MKTVLNSKTRETIVERIKSILGDEKAQWGKMSVHEMLCHSSDQIRMALGELKTDYIGSKAQETILKWLVLIGMPAPKGKVETVKELKQGIGGTKPTTFDEDKKTFIQLVNEFDQKYPPDKTVRHPAFGMMNKKEWGRLVYIHADYHLKQFGK